MTTSWTVKLMNDKLETVSVRMFAFEKAAVEYILDTMGRCTIAELCGPNGFRTTYGHRSDADVGRNR